MAEYYTGSDRVHHVWRLLTELGIRGSNARLINHRVRVWSSASISHMLCDLEFEVTGAGQIKIDIDPTDNSPPDTQATQQVATPAIYHRDDGYHSWGEFTLHQGVIVLSAYPFQVGHTYRVSLQVNYET